MHKYLLKDRGVCKWKKFWNKLKSSEETCYRQRQANIQNSCFDKLFLSKTDSHFFINEAHQPHRPN